MSRSQEDIEGEAPASQQHSGSPGGSKVTADRVALLVLSALLAAAVFVIYRLSVDNMQTRLLTLRDEYEAVKRNLTERLLEVKSCNTVQQMYPSPLEVKINGPCPTCEEGWEQHGGKCYYFSTDYLTWKKSRDQCRRQGGDLVQIDSREEQLYLLLKLIENMNYNEDKFWIGLTDSVEEGTWLWVDSSPLNANLTFWGIGQPDNRPGDDPDGQDCVRMGQTAPANLKIWFDKACKVPHRSICEKQMSTVK